MAKILKNTTGSIVDLMKFGATIPASGQITVVPQDYLLLGMPASLAEINPLISAGTIVVNDGTNNLTIADALNYVKYPDFARAVRFDNSTNGYIADDVQAAIEESNTHLLAIEVSATATASTGSGTDVLLTTMSITASAGTYLVWFSTDVTSATAGAAISFSLYNNGVQIATTLRKIIPFSGGTLTSGNARAAVSINKSVTITTGALEVRWSVSSGTSTCAARTFNMLRIT